MEKKFILTKLIFTIASLIVLNSCFAQPSIGTNSGEGLGQYGFIEKDATTFARLYKNNYDNIFQLRARWYVTNRIGNNQEYIYNTNDGSEGSWNCNNGIASKTTPNFSSSNFGSSWVAGSDAYVSVYAQYGCPMNSESHTSGEGFNERQYQIFDFEVKNDYTTGGLFDADGNCGQTATAGSNIVASFTVDFGSITNKTFNRFFFQNTGSFAEGVQIPNNGFKLFYEPSTGSETFSGSESWTTLYGDWGGNATNNNIYGADDMNISISSKMRFYVVLCDIINGSVDPSSIGSFPNAVALTLLNDGISIGGGGLKNNSQTLARIAETSFSYTAPLPVKLTSFTANTENSLVHLNWETAVEENNDYFEVQRSVNAKNFETIGKVNGNSSTLTSHLYHFTDIDAQNGVNYYRLKQVDYDKKQEFSRIISVSVVNENKFDFTIFPNPSNEIIVIKNLKVGNTVELFSSFNRLEKSAMATSDMVEFNIHNLSAGMYIIRVKQQNGSVATKKLVIE